MANDEAKKEPEQKKSIPPVEVKKSDAKIIDDVTVVDDNLFYPFADMDVGQGFFIPNEQNQTTLQAFDKMHYHIVAANKLYSEVECDENGDEVWESVNIKSRKRNADGTLQLDSSGKPIIGHDSVSRPRLIRERMYAVRQIAKDDELSDGNVAPCDGVLVVRMI